MILQVDAQQGIVLDGQDLAIGKAMSELAVAAS